MTFEIERDGVPVIAPKSARLVYYAIMAAMFMSMLDMMIVSTALPTITGDLGDLHLFGWVSSAYLLTAAVSTPFYGKFGDLFGRKPVFLFAILVFTIGSLLCGIAWSMPSLIVARLIQGAGGGGLIVGAYAIMADLFEPRIRARYQGYLSIVFTVAAISGPVFGGLVSEWFSWRWAFLVNLPMGVLVALVIVVHLVGAGRRAGISIDYAGGLLLATVIASAVLGAEQLLAHPDKPLIPLGLLALALIAGLAFVRVERGSREPIIPMVLFANPVLNFAFAIAFVQGAAGLGLMVYFPLMMQSSIGMSPLQSGLVFVPGSIMVLITSVLIGRLVSKTGNYRWYPLAGMLLAVIGMAQIVAIKAGSPLWTIILAEMTFSSSIGIANPIIIMAVQTATANQYLGAAIGTQNLLRQFGQSAGMAIFGAIMAATLAGLIRQNATGLSVDLSHASVTPQTIRQLAPADAALLTAIYDQTFDTMFLIGTAVFCIATLLGLGFARALKGHAQI